jgi:hypothetical protein
MSELLITQHFYYEFDTLGECYFGKFRDSKTDEMIVTIFRTRGKYFVFDKYENDMGNYDILEDAIHFTTEEIMKNYIKENT